MSDDYILRNRTGQISEAYFDEGLRRHMLRVYNYMGGGLVLTGIVALLVASTPAIYQPIFGTPLKWVVMLAPLAFIFITVLEDGGDVGSNRSSYFLDILCLDGPFSCLNIPCVHGSKHRKDLFHCSRYVRSNKSLWIHDAP